MNKYFKKIISAIICVVLMFTLITTAFAATVYYYFGYMYTYISNELVSLYGVTEGTDYLFIPDKLNNRKLVDIQNNAFMNNNEITGLDFGGASNLERIGSFAFFNCENIKGEVKIPSNVTTIETAAFQGCTSLDSVVFNASTGIVPNQCFSGCTSLNSVVLNDTVTEIGYYAFSNCPNLSYIEIPASVTSIAQSSFQNDTDITLGVYRNSYALEYAENNGIKYVILDPEPTEPPTELPTQEPTVVPTEAPTTEPTQLPTEISGYYLGDVNGDDVVDSIDTTIIQRYLASIPYSTNCDISHGDVNNDGITDIIDVSYIMRYLANIDNVYPIGEWQTK